VKTMMMWHMLIFYVTFMQEKMRAAQRNKDEGNVSMFLARLVVWGKFLEAMFSSSFLFCKEQRCIGGG